MKKFIPVFFTLIALTSKAQFLTIPDPVFKAHLVEHYDLNHNNEIDLSEIPAITYVEPLPGTQSLEGINSLTNLVTLDCRNTQIDSVSISGLANLVTVYLERNILLKFIDLDNLATLNQFSFLDNTVLETVLVSNMPIVRIVAGYGSPNITDLDLSQVPSITDLSLFLTSLTSLNLTGVTNILRMDFSANPGLIVNLSAQTNMTTLKLYLNNISTYTISNLPHLASVELQTSIPATLTMNNCPVLYSFVADAPSATGGFLTGLNLGTGLDSLTTLDCHYNTITGPLDLSNCKKLKRIDCGENSNMTGLNVSGLTKLTSLRCWYSKLSSLDVSSCTALTDLFTSNNQLTNIIVNGATSLGYLDCSNNQLTNLDVSGCPNLVSLSCTNNSALAYMNLKNGPTVLSYNSSANLGLRYVCADDAEVVALQNYYGQLVNVNSYCSFTPGGSYNTITGTIKADLDNNGCDPADPVLPNMLVKIDDGTQVGYTSISATGVYKFYTNAGNFTVTPQSPNPYYIFTPASAAVNSATPGGNTQTADFCLASTGNHLDLETTIIPVIPARPGFTATYKLVYKNKGSVSLSGNITLGFDDIKMGYVYASPDITTQTPGLLSWDYTGLQPFETRSIDVAFDLFAPPVTNINDTVAFTATANPVAGDETPLDNIFILKQVVRGSLDPNDKTCLEGSSIDLTRVGDYVHYLIRFQNKGTDTAFNVVVKDILTNSFNWNSLQITKTSHPCVLRQTNGNKLEFIFEGINLPQESVNEPASHGFVAFKVKTIGTLSIGDSLKNNASIYFDFNLPVITNTAASVIDSAIIIPITIEYFKGSIQAGKHLLNWKADCTSTEAKFSIERSTDGRNFINLGNITASNTRCLQPFDFTDNNPAAGINYYRIKMTDVDGKVSYSSVIALLNKKTGFEIVNLVPNPVTGGTASLNITSAEKQIINIKITDASGKIIQSMDQPVISGFTQLNMNFSKLAAGVYTIIVYTNDGERKTKQFIKR